MMGGKKEPPFAQPRFKPIFEQSIAYKSPGK